MPKQKKGPRGSRRANGEGSILQRKDGRWQFSIRRGKDEEKSNRLGRTVYHSRTVYATSRRALVRKLADLRAKSGGEIRARKPAGEDEIVSVGQFVEKWLRDSVKPSCSANTYASRESMWRLHAKPHIAKKNLADFSEDDANGLYEKLREQGAGGSVLQHVRSTLSAAFSVAIRTVTKDKDTKAETPLYSKPNPFLLAPRPKHTPKERKSLTVADARKFVKATQGKSFGEFWIVLLTCGLRLGEGLALKWTDINWERGTLSVRRSLSETDGVDVQDVKTHRSIRPVALGKVALEALRRRQKQAEREGHGSLFIFTGPSGAHPRRSNLRLRSLQPIFEKAGIEPVTIHELRHSMGSLMIDQGADIKAVSERLGHADVAFTLRTYQHVLPGRDLQAAAVMDAVLAPKRIKRKKPAQRL